MSEANGTNGSIHFDGRFVTIKPKRGLTGMLSGRSEVRVPLKSISQMEWSGASALKSGYVRVCTNGMTPLQGNAIRPAFLDAAQDPNSIVFNKKQQDAMSRLRDDIDEALAG